MFRFPQALNDDVRNPSLATIGGALNRVDGPSKVTGSARYAADVTADELVYGYVVCSSIARGRITQIQTQEAERIAGVLKIFTHRNRPSLAWFDHKWKDDDSPHGSPFRPLYDDQIVFNQQPVALVVAQSFEIARHAASRIIVEYEVEPFATDLRHELATARTPHKGKGGFEPPPNERGDALAALTASDVTIAVEYQTAAQHHNPMELFATTVVVGDKGALTIHTKTQGVANDQKYVQNVFGLSKSDVTVRAPFVGGGFGSGLRPQYQLFLAVLAATTLKRSVQVVLTRQQMFSFGHRPETLHRLSLGASNDGRLNAILHQCDSETSRFEDYVEVVVNWSALLYQCDNVQVQYQVVPLDTYTPLDMRAPGATQGVFALECAMDELAYRLKMDPIALRLRNYAEKDQVNDRPFSSKELRACFSEGAARFGWHKRKPQPGSMREGHLKIGYGMACGVWDAMQMPASAKACLSDDATLTVSSATADIGTGTYTVMTQIAAEVLGLEPGAVRFELGDTSLPSAPLQGGSWTVSSVGTAVKGVCDQVVKRLVKLAQSLPGGEFEGARLEDVLMAEGHLTLRSNPAMTVSITELMAAAGVSQIEESVTALPNLLKQRGHTKSAHSAVFVEVGVDEDLGTITVRRVVSAVAGGRIINPKTARSQILGSVVWGIGMALEEATMMDDQLGRYMNHSFAEYHIPVNADIPPDIDVIFVDERDDIVNPLGAKGLGEIGLVGVAAAVGNAVFHATGRRVRQLPITLDTVMAS